MGAISGLGVGPVHAAASTTPKSRMRCGFHAGGVRLKLVWCGSMLTAVIHAPPRPPRWGSQTILVTAGRVGRAMITPDRRARMLFSWAIEGVIP
jgi:hypothetical protein